MSDPIALPEPPADAELAAIGTRNNSSYLPRSGVAPMDSLPSRFDRGRTEMNDSPYKPRLLLPMSKNAIHTRDCLSQFEDRMDMYRTGVVTRKKWRILRRVHGIRRRILDFGNIC